jgi:hypothetical protein
MEFHQTCQERFAEMIINTLSKKFDGKVMNSYEMTIDIMLKSITYESDDDSIDISPVPEKVVKTIKVNNEQEDVSDDVSADVSDNVSDDVSDNEQENTTVIDDNSIIAPEELFKDNIPEEPDNKEKGKKGKKGKKEKKEKKEKKDKKEKKESDPDKPKKPANCYINWKLHPDNTESINNKAEEINEETGKKYGITRAAGILWKLLSEDEKQKWKPV